MKLLIDIGNSRIKPALLEAGAIRSLEPRAWRGSDLAETWAAVLAGVERPDAVVVSNVAGREIADALRAAAGARFGLAPRFVAVREELAGVRTVYDRPAQLGVDRWLAAVAAFALVRGPVCAIDAGTALTVDVVGRDGVHRGGLIAPGMALMARSLTHGTAQLGAVEVHAVRRFATNTADAIALGCFEAVAGLVARAAERFERELGEPATWVVTGGEAAAVVEASSVPLLLVPDLVLRGIALDAERTG